MFIFETVSLARCTGKHHIGVRSALLFWRTLSLLLSSASLSTQATICSLDRYSPAHNVVKPAEEVPDSPTRLVGLWWPDNTADQPIHPSKLTCFRWPTHPLSTFYEFAMLYDGNQFHSIEQAYQFNKAREFHDEDLMRCIREAGD